MSVYIIVAETVNAAKIGFANAPLSRLQQLQTGSPVPLKLAAVIPGDLSNETDLHRRFGGDRLHGEWFVCSGALKALVHDFALEREPPEPSIVSDGEHSPTQATSYGAALVDWLKDTRTTQSALAERLNVTQATINRYCNHERFPHPSMAMKIERATGGAVSFARFTECLMRKAGLAA